jgi:hypothetical protein
MALPASLIAAFAVFGVLRSLWAMIAYRPFGGLDLRQVVLLTQSTAGQDSNFISAVNSLSIQTRAKSFTTGLEALSPRFTRGHMRV